MIAINILKTSVSIILGIVAFYFAFYAIVGLFFTRKFKPAKKLHKYAILIAARNEETVIGNLLESIKRQDYPKEYLTVFVVADNCNDRTAAIARENGAICYERFDTQRRTKGFALQFLFENIRKDYGIEAFEGYFIFDADNLLNIDYISRMNDSFDEGEKIITSYRNTKNFDENWIASTYAIHWLRSIRLTHRARSVLRLATNIQGTGFLFANELVRDGWKYTSLTEDRAFTADAVAHGYPISYNDAAEFFDEQPTSLKIAFRQRIRWSKGHLLAFFETGWLLFKNIFLGNSFRDKTKKEKFTKKKLIEGIRTRWASFDTLVQLFPAAIITTAIWLVFTVIMSAVTCYNNGADASLILGGNDMFSKVMQFIFKDGISFSIVPGLKAALVSVMIAFIIDSVSRIAFHIVAMLAAVYVFIAERKRIIKIPLRKKILYTLTWPIFDALGRWTLYIALFKKVEWKPIPHTSSVTITEIESSKEEILKH